MHSQQPPGVVQNWSTLQCSKHNTEQCGYDHAPVTRGRMRTQFPMPHGRGSNPPLQDGRGACCPLYYDAMLPQSTDHPSHIVCRLCPGATPKN